MHEIEISNFGPLARITLKVDQLTLVIGEQATGKSTVTKLIYYFRRFQTYFTTLYETFNANEWRKFYREYRSHLKSTFTNTFGSTATLGDFEIVYHYSQDNWVKLTRTADGKYINVDLSEGLIDDLEDIWTKARDIRNHAELNVNQSKIRELAELNRAEKAFCDSYSCIYIPAGRAMLSKQMLLDLIQANEFSMKGLQRNDPSPFDLIDAMTRDYMLEVSYMRGALSRVDLQAFADNISSPERKKVYQLMLSLQHDILKGNYSTDGKQDYIIAENHKKIPYSYASSGQQEALWITNLLLGHIARAQRKSFILVEEPESHLHPNAQYALIKFLIAYKNLSNSQIFVTTHSPYIISSINNLLYASRQAHDKGQDIIRQIIPSEYWANEDAFQSFLLDGGELVDIKDPELKMIDISVLDQIASLQDDEYEKMLCVPGGS